MSLGSSLEIRAFSALGWLGFVEDVAPSMTVSASEKRASLQTTSETATRHRIAAHNQPMNARDTVHVPERSTMKRTKSSLLAFKLREVSTRSARGRAPAFLSSTCRCIALCQAVAATRAQALSTRLITHPMSRRLAVSRRQGQCPVLRPAAAPPA